MSDEAKRIQKIVDARRAELRETDSEEPVQEPINLGEQIDFAKLLPNWIKTLNTLDEVSTRAWDERVRRIHAGSATPEDLRIHDMVTLALSEGRELPAEARVMPGPELPKSLRTWAPESLDNPQRAIAMGIPPLIASEIASEKNFFETRSTRACSKVGIDYLFLVLIGAPGCGKSYAAARWLWKTDVDKLISYAMKRIVVPRRFLEAPALVDVEFKDRPALGRCKALVIDDVGTEKDFLRQDLAALFVARYRNGLPTVVTTNSTREDFIDYYGLRVADRMKEIGRFVTVSNDARDSLRGRGDD